MQLYWNAFWRLHKSRGSGFSGPSPISIESIQSYCEIQGIQSTEKVCRIIDYIQAMDNKVMEIAEKKNANESKDEDVDNNGE